MARITTAWRKGRFGFLSLVPRHRCQCILVFSLTMKESPEMWRKPSAKFAVKKLVTKVKKALLTIFVQKLL